MRKNLIQIALVSVALSTGLSPLVARPEGGEKRIAQMQKQLGLSDEQTGKIKGIESKYAPQREAIQKRIKPLREDLRKLSEMDEPDMSAVRQKLQEIGAARTDLRILLLQERVETRHVLTPDQKKKWDDEQRKHREKMRERFEKDKKDHT